MRRQAARPEPLVTSLGDWVSEPDIMDNITSTAGLNYTTHHHHHHASPTSRSDEIKDNIIHQEIVEFQVSRTLGINRIIQTPIITS